MKITKETFFILVQTKGDVVQQLEGLTDRWNEYTCWEGTDAEVRAHDNEVRRLRHCLDTIDAQLRAARKEVPAEELRSWRTDWYALKNKRQNGGIWVVVKRGDYEGLAGQVLETGSFDVFGQQVEGAKIQLPGMAGPVVLSYGYFTATDAPEERPVLERFQKGGKMNL